MRIKPKKLLIVLCIFAIKNSIKISFRLTMTSKETVLRLDEIRKSYADLASLEYRVRIVQKTIKSTIFRRVFF